MVWRILMQAWTMSLIRNDRNDWQPRNGMWFKHYIRSKNGHRWKRMERELIMYLWIANRILSNSEFFSVFLSNQFLRKNGTNFALSGKQVIFCELSGNKNCLRRLVRKINEFKQIFWLTNTACISSCDSHLKFSAQSICNIASSLFCSKSALFWAATNSSHCCFLMCVFLQELWVNLY